MTKKTIKTLEEIVEDLKEVSKQLDNPDATIKEQSYFKGIQFSIRKIEKILEELNDGTND
jgi:methyl-accepting chemotaxis protein